jgi:hypothetical protein
MNIWHYHNQNGSYLKNIVLFRYLKSPPIRYDISKNTDIHAVAHLGGGIVPWPPLWLMGKFFCGLEDRWKGGWPPFRRIWAENWKIGESE